jgi:hypothetical protein
VKQYDPYRGPFCPTGQHEATDPKDGDGNPLAPDLARARRLFNEECTCPWLVVTSTTPVPHMTSWSRRELDTLIREADRGFFDPVHYPPRNNASQFMSPSKQRLLELLDMGDTVGAIQALMVGLEFDRVTWDPEQSCLSLRYTQFGASGIGHEWLQIFVAAEDGQYTARGPQAGGNPETIDGLWSEPDPQEQAERAAQRVLVDSTRAQVRGLVGALPTVKADSDGKPWIDIPLPGLEPEHGGLLTAVTDVEATAEGMVIIETGDGPR